MKRIIESYKRKLAGEEGWILKRGAQLRIALCYPNVYSIGMANLGFQAMYEIFNRLPEVSCERGFLPDDVNSGRSGKGSGYDQALSNTRASDTRPLDEMGEYERTRTPLLSLESQTKLRDFDVIAFSISFETDYVNLARMLQMSGVPVWAKDRTKHDPLIVMGGAASFLNPEPIAEFTDVIGVGEGEILGPRISPSPTPITSVNSAIGSGFRKDAAPPITISGSWRDRSFAQTGTALICIMRAMFK